MLTPIQGRVLVGFSYDSWGPRSGARRKVQAGEWYWNVHCAGVMGTEYDFFQMQVDGNMQTG